jgi:CheY-like chemotaxis protein/HPt (histidine-containing phosphotransfer) domain-containing protein
VKIALFMTPSKIESGRMLLEQSAFDLDELLDRLDSLFSMQVEEKMLDFSVEAAPDVPRALIGDPLRLQQVLSNLLGNAIKFTEKGHISVEVSLLAVDASHASIRWLIEDSGIGMDAAGMANIFQPFHQADSSISRRFGGTGLGLSISRELLQMMGSELEVRSTSGEGSTFSFDLQLGIAPELAKKEEARQQMTIAPDSLTTRLAMQGGSLAGKRILLAEDTLMNQQIVKEFLRMSGLQVEVVSNGRQALEILDKMSFDAILMDVHMPVMNGLEATRQIRLKEQHQLLPIIALTAGVTPDERKETRACGMNDIVAKPVDPVELLRVLLQWIPTETEPEIRNETPAPSAPPEPSPPPEPASTSARLELPGFHLEKILEMLDNNAAKVIRLLEMFRNDVLDIPDQIEHELARGHGAAAKSLSHQLRGAAGNVGALALFDAAEKLDRELLSDAAGAETLAELRACHANAMEQIAKLAAHPARMTRTPDPQALKASVDRIERLLRSQELVPDELMEELESLLPEHMSERFHLLKRHVDNIDYNHAIDIIRTLPE